MPAKLEVDYETMFAAYCKGLSFEDLAEQFRIKPGSLRAYASRNKWQQRAANAREALQRSIANDLTAKGGEFASRISSVLDKQLTVLEKRDPEALSIEDWEAFTRILERTMNIGRTTYGMDAKTTGSGGTLVQVNVAAPTTATTTTRTTGAPVDVEALPVLSGPALGVESVDQ